MRVRGGAWEAVRNTAILGDRPMGARQKGKKPPAERKNKARFTKKNGGFEARATPGMEKAGIFYLEKDRFSVMGNGAASNREQFALPLPTTETVRTPVRMLVPPGASMRPPLLGVCAYRTGAKQECKGAY